MNCTDLNKGFLVANSHTGDWFFCSTTKEADDVLFSYRFDNADQIKSQEDLIRELAHLANKAWFEPDKFFELFKSITPY